MRLPLLRSCRQRSLGKVSVGCEHAAAPAFCVARFDQMIVLSGLAMALHVSAQARLIAVEPAPQQNLISVVKPLLGHPLVGQ